MNLNRSAYRYCTDSREKASGQIRRIGWTHTPIKVPIYLVQKREYSVSASDMELLRRTIHACAAAPIITT